MAKTTETKNYLLRALCLESDEVLMLPVDVEANDLGDEKAIKKLLRNKLMVEDSLIDGIYKWLLDWLHVEIGASQGQPLQLTAKHVREAFISARKHAERHDLFDHSKPLVPTVAQRMMQVNDDNRELYLRQLEWIGASVEERLEAIGEYCVAFVNRDAWIKDESVSIDEIEELDAAACIFHGRAERKHKRELKSNPSEAEKQKLGCDVLDDCYEWSRDQNVGTMKPPRQFVDGEFHYLANRGELGWHYDWKMKVAQFNAAKKE